MKKKIMLLARDPGGANTVIPLVKPLQDRGYQVELYGKETALRRYCQMGLSGQDIDKMITEIKIGTLREFLFKNKPDFIITGTSGDDFTERYLWEAARDTGIKTFAILDQWINYGIRFSGFTLKEKEQYQYDKLHSFLPDYILVMDETARQEMIREGIDAERIKISGQPYFDMVISARNSISAEQILDFKMKMGCQPDELIIAYISEPISQDYSSHKGEPYWGFDEKGTCIQILDALEKVIKPSGKHATFIIKQHPRENQDNYNFLDNELKHNINIRIVKDIDSWPLLLTSDLVCGMASMLLLEAIILGCPVLSIQIGLNRTSPLVWAQYGILSPILQQGELEEALFKILLDKNLSVVSWKIETGAVEKVIAYMEELV